jgi:DNA-binding beta-propeller fold protein YncE
VGEIEVGALPEGVAFSPDGQFLYVGNWGEQELVTYRLDGDKLTTVGSPLKLPGHPASMRGTTP